MKRWLVWGIAFGLASCGGGDGTDAGGGPDGGTDGGAGVPVDVTFEVLDDRDGSPVAGATVAVDLGDGARVEEVSDASGQVTFSVDWGLGAIDVTTHAAGFGLDSTVGATAAWIAAREERGVAPIRLRNPDPRTDLVTLSGTFTGISDATHRFNVIPALADGTTYNGIGPDYSVTVPPGAAFRVAALEYSSNVTGTNDYTQVFYGQVHQDVDALGGDTTLDLDLSSPETLIDVDVTVRAPGTGTPLADGQLYAIVTDAGDLNAYYGAVTRAAPSGGDVDLTLSYAAPSGATPATRYLLSDDPLLSQVIVEGAPRAGAQTVAFPPPPAIVTPAFGVMHPLHDPFVIGRIEPGLETSLLIYDLEQDDRLLWSIRSPEGSETIAIPAPPSSVDPAALFPPTGDFYARPLVCEPHATDRRCVRLAIGGRVFDLVP